MSLLLKALKQAEQGQGKTASASPDLDLEPLAETPFSVRREWVQPHDSTVESPMQPSRPRGGFSLPQLGLVPTTALLALLIALGYGTYVYLAINQPTLMAPSLAHTQAQLDTQNTRQPLPLPPQPAALDPQAGQPAASPEPKAASPRPVSAPARKPVPTPPPASPDPASVGKAGVVPSAAQAMPTLQRDAARTDLDAAYQAYQAGRLDEAKSLYGKMADRDRNPDALLGLAAIAMVQGHQAESIRLYQRVISIDPRNTVAQAALIDALGTTDSTAAESRLKNQIQQSPTPYLYYTLGNLYADQKRWSDAESAYFEAFRREPSNGDYAFNLAISLDHLQQYDAALRHYETALSLAGLGSQFSRSQAQARIQQLKER
jgi:tetratricopeptide (TPR) repeat protein